ncbi:PAS domain-containing sensor histidine kinase [Archangium sp. Cb G35]|nr:PAS domain-containing sensor histidine kinase [Archangium sp. Cb G35]
MPSGGTCLETRRSETTVEELLEVIARLAANEPNVRCRVGEGPLAPLATALNTLSGELDSRRIRSDETFGPEVLVSQSPVAMMACDADERIRYMNYTFPGLTLSEVVGRKNSEFTPPEDVEMVRGHVRHVLTTGEPVFYEHRPNIGFGPEWFGVHVGPIRSGGEVVGYTMSLTDITELKRTQFRLEQSNRELESFASVASHDLQEPLRKIQTFGERLKTTCGAALSPEGRDYLERMNNAAGRMRRLIDDLLSFSRISSRAPTFVRVDLGRVAREVLGDLETAIEQSGASMTVGELPTLEAEPMQMRQLLQNLVSNALKFRQEGVAPSVSISATVDADAGQCELRVKDNGIGFDEKYLDRIFNVFQRLHGRGKYEGTGIGLAICRKIVERHGGHIGARSSPGQGATFIVSLPLKPPQSR